MTVKVYRSRCCHSLKATRPDATTYTPYYPVHDLQEVEEIFKEKIRFVDKIKIRSKTI